jgi:hypothetical protein
LGRDVVFGSSCLMVRWVEVGAAGISCWAPHVVGDICCSRCSVPA